MNTNLDTKGWEQKKCIEKWNKKYLKMLDSLDIAPLLMFDDAEIIKAFIRQELSLAKQQWMDEILVKLKKMPKGCNCSYGTIVYGKVINLLDGMS